MNHKINANKAVDKLVTWYEEQKRDLPWRTLKPEPYKVWISEIMLQQTTSQAVKAYYKKFLNTFPDVKTLSEATQEEVNENWQGLGYYSRARNILKTAKLIVNEYNKKFPNTSKELIKLPGIGPYTASAIASICFEEKIGVVDGNVLRVHNRLVGKKLDWWKPDFHKKTQEFSNSLCKLNHKASKVNQALMDLGATICTPKSPACLLCPLSSMCLSKENDLQNEIPTKKPKIDKEIWHYEVFKNSLKSENLYVAINSNQPVLKKNLLPIGSFKKLSKKPDTFSFVHSITNHQIYVSFKKRPNSLSDQRSRKISLKELNQTTPSSLIKKIWQADEFHGTM